MFDVSTLAAEECFQIILNHPATGEPLDGEGGKPCAVTVYGPGSKPFAAAKAAASNRAVKRLRAKGSVESSAEEDAAATASFLAAVTKSLDNFTYKDGEPGPAMFKALYLDPGMGWLAEQVNNGAGDWANFTAKSPKP